MSLWLRALFSTLFLSHCNHCDQFSQQLQKQGHILFCIKNEGMRMLLDYVLQICYIDGQNPEIYQEEFDVQESDIW